MARVAKPRVFQSPFTCGSPWRAGVGRGGAGARRRSPGAVRVGAILASAGGRMPRVSAGPDFAPVAWRDGTLEILDQTLLPLAESWLRLTRLEEVADAIRRLAVRGAPAIGIAAAYGLALALADPADPEPDPARRFER